MGWNPSSRAAAHAGDAISCAGAAAEGAVEEGAAAAAAAEVAEEEEEAVSASRGEGVADSGEGSGRLCAASLRLRRAAGGTWALSVAVLLHAASSLCCGSPLLRLRLWLCGARRAVLSAAWAWACIAVGWAGAHTRPSGGCAQGKWEGGE